MHDRTVSLHTDVRQTGHASTRIAYASSVHSAIVDKNVQQTVEGLPQTQNG